MKAITVCVQFHDYLAITLPRNLRFFKRFLVVTHRDDLDTRYLIADFQEQCPALGVFCTDAFYRKTRFNKGLALEEGFDRLGRDGWLCVMDADVVLSPAFADATEYLEPGNIYAPKERRKAVDPLTMVEYADQPVLWDDLEIISEMRLQTHGQDGGAGYCQIFHADDPVLAEYPWYPTHWVHAGGCDTEFFSKWPPEKRKRLDFPVLHLGEERHHWCGRRGPMLDGTPIPHSKERQIAIEEMFAQRKYRGLEGEIVRPRGARRPQTT